MKLRVKREEMTLKAVHQQHEAKSSHTLQLNQTKKILAIIQNESEARHLPKDFAKITKSLGSCLQIKNMHLHTTKVANRPFAF